jgi:hypothetical protein
MALDDLESTIKQKFTEAYYIHIAATTSTGSEISKVRR